MRAQGGGGNGRHAPRAQHLHAGEAVQVDPIRSTLKAPGTDLLTLEYDDLLSYFAFNFDLRHHTLAVRLCKEEAVAAAAEAADAAAAGTYTRPLFSST